MKRTLLVTLDISPNEDISAYADDILSLLQDEGLPVTACIPWGQSSSQQSESDLGQTLLPTQPTPPVEPQTSFDPWLPQ